MRIQIDLTSDTPIYQQIRDEIVLGLGRGELSEGDVLPSVRQLALDLGINHMTVNKAYQQLKAEQFIVIDRRKGATIAVKPQNSKKMSAKHKDKLTMVLAEGLSQVPDPKNYRQNVLDLLDAMIKERSSK